jgi:hypothetical protein
MALLTRITMWDLEGFYLDGSTLTMVSGYDPQTALGNQSIGDVFLDVDGDARYGATENSGTGYGNTLRPNGFGYDYVLDLDVASGMYSVYTIDPSADVRTIRYKQNVCSNPWTYVRDGDPLGSPAPIEFSGKLLDEDVAEYGLQGGAHYAMSFTLDFLQPDTEFTSHVTMRCGNDNLMGQGRTPPPEEPRQPVPDGGATVMLLGLALVGLKSLSLRK